MQRHVTDHYVKASQNQGYRARSAYKLIELLAKKKELDDIFHKRAANILDLGAAPGSWSDALVKRSPSLKIVALDLLPMPPLNGVCFIQADLKDVISKQILPGETLYDGIICDACVNLSGIQVTDRSANFELWRAVVDILKAFSKKDGAAIMKYFESPEAKSIRQELEDLYSEVHVIKPPSSRSESAEKYFVCLKRKG